MRAGSFNAQLGVELHITQRTLTMRAMGRSIRLEREHLQQIRETSILGIFKRGISFRHNQADLPNPIVFFPAIGRSLFRRTIEELGWR